MLLKILFVYWRERETERKGRERESRRREIGGMGGLSMIYFI